MDNIKMGEYQVRNNIDPWDNTILYKSPQKKDNKMSKMGKTVLSKCLGRIKGLKDKNVIETIKSTENIFIECTKKKYTFCDYFKNGECTETTDLDCPLRKEWRYKIDFIDNQDDKKKTNNLELEPEPPKNTD